MIIAEGKIYDESNYNDIPIINNNFSILEESYKNLLIIEENFQNIKDCLFKMKISSLTESYTILTEGTVWDKIKEAISNFGKTIMSILRKAKDWFLGLFKRADNSEKNNKVNKGKKAAKEKKLTAEQEAKLNEKSNETKGYEYNTSIDFKLDIKSKYTEKLNNIISSNNSLTEEQSSQFILDYAKELISSMIKNTKTSFAIDEIDDPKSVFILYLRGKKIDNIYKYYLENDIISSMKDIYEKNTQNIKQIETVVNETVNKDNKAIDELKNKNLAEEKINFVSKFIETTQKVYSKAITQSIKETQNALKQIQKAETFFASINEGDSSTNTEKNTNESTIEDTFLKSLSLI